MHFLIYTTKNFPECKVCKDGLLEKGYCYNVICMGNLLLEKK